MVPILMATWNDRIILEFRLDCQMTWRVHLENIQHYPLSRFPLRDIFRESDFFCLASSRLERIQNIFKCHISKWLHTLNLSSSSILNLHFP